MAGCAHIWHALLLLLLVSAPRSCPALAQSSSAPAAANISIACGSSSSFTDDGVLWVPDSPYVFAGKAANVPNTGPVLHPWSRLRYFPDGRKNCFQVAVQNGIRYLVRATFVYGRYDTQNFPPRFGVAVDATYVRDVWLQPSSAPLSDLQAMELIFSASRSSVSFCLVSLPGGGSPVISSLEFRPVPPAGYFALHASSTMYDLVHRLSCSGDVFNTSGPTWPGRNATSIINNSTVCSACVEERIGVESISQGCYSGRIDFVMSIDNSSAHYLILYLSELYGSLPAGENIDIFVNDEQQFLDEDVPSSNSSGPSVIPTRPLWLHQDVTSGGFLNISFVSQTGSPVTGPPLDALEVYSTLPMAVPTRQDDVQALLQFRSSFPIYSGLGDPCLPTGSEWDGVTCSLDTGPPTVTTLNLAGTDLMGPLPSDLNLLVNLENLWLGDNFLTGPIPEVSNLSRLSSLDLHDNELSGTIPDYIFSLPHLRSLMLQQNNLSGSISSSRLRSLDDSKIQYNFTGNRYLSFSGTSSGNIRMKILIGALVGGIGFCLLVVIGGFMVCCICKQSVELSEKGTSLLSASPPSYVMKPLSLPAEFDWLPGEVQQFSLKEVESATKNFKSMIGEGGFGAVFYGTLPDGQAVAVKVRSASSHQGAREFYSEINLLKKVRHENLVPLIGSCSDGDCQILVYPYMSNGSLQDRLYGEAARRKSLDWQTRLTIALGAARGLYFLHTGGDRCIIHRDVKSSNILLDHRMVAKVADFGLSKYAPQEGDSLVSTEVRGTAGYLDPEYYATQQLTEKSDVFSFGIVLLEIICGREPLNIHRPRPEWSLVEWARPFIREQRLQEIVDPAISGTYTAEAMWRVLEIAICSVEPHAIHRPTMGDIIRELDDALIIENNASQYMASAQSLDSLCLSVTDIRIPSNFPPAFPLDPSPVFSETMDSPNPR